MRPAPGHLGPYELLDMLGQGAMGTVYRARHVELGAVRAVKVLLGNQTAPRVERFLRETRHLANVRHPNVVGVHDVGQSAEGHLFYAMDLVEGEALDRVLSRGRLDYDRALEVAVGICRGVEALHQVGILHRDLKPANVVLRPGGEPVVLDLGLAVAPERDQRITKTGALLGTPHYMAPEQIRGEKATASSDVYALGLIAHELLSGYSIVDSGELPGFVKVPAPSSVDGDLPRAFDRICGRALARDLQDRYSTVAELIDALEALREAPGITRRVLRRVQLGLTSALALVGLGVVIVANPLAATGNGSQPSVVPRLPTLEPPPARNVEQERRATRELQRLVRLEAMSRRRDGVAAWIERNPEHPQLEVARIYLRDAQLRSPLYVQSMSPQAQGTREAAFLMDGTAVSCLPGRPLTRWRLDTHETLETWDIPAPATLAASPSGEEFTVASFSRGLISIRLAPPGQRVLASPGRIWALAYSRDGRTLAYVERRSVFVIDLAQGGEPELVGEMRSSAGKKASTTVVAFSPDGFHLATGGDKELGLHVWDLRTRTLVYQAPQLSKIYAIAFAPDGKTFVIGRGGGTLGVMTLDDPRQIARIGEAAGGSAGAGRGVRALSYTLDGKHLYSLEKPDRTRDDGPGLHVIWDAKTYARLATIEHAGANGGKMTLSPDGTRLLVTTHERLELWEAGLPPALPALATE